LPQREFAEGKVETGGKEREGERERERTIEKDLRR